jgi:hypothetical protein
MRGFFVLALLTECCCAMQKAQWQRYENSGFVAFSNGAASDVETVLVELEYIRAAAGQTPGFAIPAERPKTVAVLLATAEEFARIAPLSTMAGFAQSIDGRALIALPLQGVGDSDARIVVRHEFAHTLLFNDWFRYPQWYAEGFAELVSGIVVDRRNNSFQIGTMPVRYSHDPAPAVDWNDLIVDGFDAHQLTEPKQIQRVYA